MPACSRCGCLSPNRSCVVCWEEPEPERDAFQAHREAEWMEENPVNTEPESP